MDELIKIGNQKITIKEYRGQRVVTFKDIDLVHERPEGTAGRNFRENRKRFIEAEDYFQRNSSEAQKEYGIIAPNGLTLITEQGYLMLVKSLTDDLAWDVQRSLVKNYFVNIRRKSAIELMQDAVLEVNEKIENVNEDLQQFKQDLPILGVEESKITNAVRRKGVHCLGGKESNSYKDKSLRGKVYSDIYGQLKRQFGVDTYKAIKRSQCAIAIKLIENYELPFALNERIENYNQQLILDIGVQQQSA